MVKNKLKKVRNEKNITQSQMAELMFMSQSQYQRREQGLICISDDEWERLAKCLEKEVDDIKEDDASTTINNYDNHSGSYSASNNYFCNIPELLLKNQQDYIEMLKTEIVRLK